MPAAPDVAAPLGLGEVFTLLFVMLGPFKLLGPFAKMTQNRDAAEIRKIALLSFGIAVVAVLLGGFVGRSLISKWHVSLPALLLAGGIIFALVGLRLVLEQYEPPSAAPPPTPAATPFAAAVRFTFPAIVTPYGIAALIILLANSADAARTQGILLILLAVMVFDLLAMLAARWILRGVVVAALQILGSVLGVLQVALAIQMILRALRSIGPLHG